MGSKHEKSKLKTPFRRHHEYSPLINNNSSYNSINSSNNNNSSYNSINSSTGSYSSIGSDFGLKEQQGSIFSSIFSLVSTMTGGGILSIPFAFQQGGFVVASIVLVVACCASAYSSFLIIRSKKYCMGRVRNIEDVGKMAFGRNGQVLAQIIIIGFCFLATVAYMILFTDQIRPLLILGLGPNSVVVKKISLLSIALLVVFPVALLKNLSALKYTSGFSMLCSLFVCGCVAYRSINADMGGPIRMSHNPIKLYPGSTREFLTCVAIIEVTFTCHMNVLPMHDELRKQTTRNKRVIIVISMCIAYLASFVISLFGYFQFRSHTKEVITQNYSHTDLAMNCGRAALCCSILLTTPVIIVPCRETINKMIWGNLEVQSTLRSRLSNSRFDGPNKWVWFIETFAIVLTVYLLAFLIPKISLVWGLVGAIGSTSLVYILPPAFYLRVRDPNKNGCFKRACAYVILVMGCLLLVVGVYQWVMNVIALFQHGSHGDRPDLKNQTFVH